MENHLADAATADVLVKIGWHLLGSVIALAVGVISTLLWGRGGYKRVKQRLDALESQERAPAITQAINFNSADSANEHERHLRNAVNAVDTATAQGLKETIRKLPQHPLGDGHTYASLPDGTNIVSMADGSYRLALPVHLETHFRTTGGGSASLKGPSATEDDEGAVASEAWRAGAGAGLLAAEAIEKAASMDEARRIFRAFQAQQSRRNVDEAYAAYKARLKREGLEDSQEALDVGWDEGGEE